MKCVEFTASILHLKVYVGDIYRVKNETAAALVKQGKAGYVPRSKWRDRWGEDREAGYLHSSLS